MLTQDAQARSISDVWQRFRTLLAEDGGLLVLAAIPGIVAELVAFAAIHASPWLSTRSGGLTAGKALQLLVILAMVGASHGLSAALVTAVAVRGLDPSARAGFARRLVTRLPHALLGLVLLTLLVFAGFVLCVLPGLLLALYACLRYPLVLPALFSDSPMGHAARRARDLSRGRSSFLAATALFPVLAYPFAVVLVPVLGMVLLVSTGLDVVAAPSLARTIAFGIPQLFVMVPTWALLATTWHVLVCESEREAARSRVQAFL